MSNVTARHAHAHDCQASSLSPRQRDARGSYGTTERHRACTEGSSRGRWHNDVHDEAASGRCLGGRH